MFSGTCDFFNSFAFIYLFILFVIITIISLAVIFDDYFSSSLFR